MVKGIDYIGVAAAAFLHDGEGNYLLGLRTDKCRDEHGKWEPAGGGGIKFGELIENALLREVKEEVGVVPFNVEYLGLREVHSEHEGKKTHWLVYDYKAQVDPSNVKIMEPSMCAEIRWCSLDNLPSPLTSQFPGFLDKYRNKL